VNLPIEFSVKAAEKQYEIWETRVRLADKRLREQREKDAVARAALASSPAPDGDVEMHVALPSILVKKRSVVEVCIVMVCCVRGLTYDPTDRLHSRRRLGRRSTILLAMDVRRRRGGFARP
jgi:hypothetical protein